MSKKMAESKKKGRPELGGSGTTNFYGMIDTGEYVTKLTGTELYKTVDQMRWSDATVQAALLMCELPIRSAEWDVEPASESAQDVEIAEFVKENLFNGLISSWEDTLRQILLMHPFGCMVLEVVYKITDEGKIAWRKWAPRLPKTIERWNTDKNGELENIIQRVQKDNSYQDIEIPVEKLMVFVHRKEGDNYLGTSILRQAYKHWFFRDKYYKIDAVAQERLGIGIPLITLPDGYTDDDYDAAKELGKNFRGHEKAYVIIKDGWMVEMMDLKNSGVRDPMPMLDHHTREILKSVLAQFLDLGSKSVGSYALSKDQSKIFLNSLDASAKVVEGGVNDEIKKLVDYNWTVEEYPKLTHADLGSVDVQELSEALQTLTLASVIQPDDELEDYMRRLMKLPEKGLPRETEGEDEAGNKNKGNKKPNDESKDEKEDKNEDTKQTHSEYRRPLTKAEQKVRFDEIRDYMDTAEMGIVRRMKDILAMEKSKMLSVLEIIVRNKDFVRLNEISLRLKSKYIKMFKEEIKKLFEYGKLKASYEIKKPSPQTTKEMNQAITDRAVFLSERYQKQVVDRIKEVAAVAMMDRDIDTKQTMMLVKGEFGKFNSKNIPATSALVTSESINEGRKYTFKIYEDDLYAYQWSAILDKHTCNYCMSMDGKVIGVRDKAFNEYRPGAVHFRCRCIWVAITKEEKDPPTFTGIPSRLRPQSEVPPWHFKDLERPLPGAGGRKIPYGVFNEFGNLPDDTIWRTIGGKRVPISSKTGKPVEKGGGGGGVTKNLKIAGMLDTEGDPVEKLSKKIPKGEKR